MKLKIKIDRFTETSSAQDAVLLVIARYEAIKGSKGKRVLIPEAAHRETIIKKVEATVGIAIVVIQEDTLAGCHLLH